MKNQKNERQKGILGRYDSAIQYLQGGDEPSARKSISYAEKDVSEALAAGLLNKEQASAFQSKLDIVKELYGVSKENIENALQYAKYKISLLGVKKRIETQIVEELDPLLIYAEAHEFDAKISVTKEDFPDWRVFDEKMSEIDKRINGYKSK